MFEEKNYEFNRNFQFDGCPINGQGASKVSLCRYGLFPMSWNGCEIIALYNWFILSGKPVELCDVAREVYPYGAVLCGFFGTDPRKVGPFFNSHGVSVKSEQVFRRFLRDFDEKGLAVVSFWTGCVLRSSVHTVCVQKKPDGVLVYNWSNRRRSPRFFGSLTEFLNKTDFIVGFTET